MAHARRYFKRSDAAGGDPMRSGVGDHRAALRDRAERQASRCARTTAPSTRGGAADPGETTCVSARAAGGNVTEEPLAAAIRYGLRNWVALTRYAEDGRLKIDNNCAEQAL